MIVLQSQQWRFPILFQSILCIFYIGVESQDYSCTWPDPCPTAEDGVCEAAYSETPSENPFCQQGDCVDCNVFCSQFDADCAGCLGTTGCYWCPGDGRCSNSPLYTFDLMSACSADSLETFLTGPDASQCSSSSSFFSDPLYEAQAWVFEMIDLLPVWQQNLTGSGIRVRINDDGVDPDVTELEGRLDLEASCPNAQPVGLDASHGTWVASVLGATGNNGDCAVGIAPNVTFSSCNLFVGGGNSVRLSDFGFNLDQFDISVNSIGLQSCGATPDDNSNQQLRRSLQNTCPFTIENALPCDDCDFADPLAPQTAACDEAILLHCKEYFDEEIACLEFLDLIIGGLCDFNQIPESDLDEIRNGIANGRDGKGIIFVFGSGNRFEVGEDVNFSSITNSRLTITVGAVSKQGLHASYSTSGAALLVTAPGGDVDSLSNHVGATVGGGCTTQGVGTSFSTPVVGGVVALMLEVNPELTWRDVQGILVETSSPVEDDNDTTRTTNGAGLVHSNLYGFGIVNASQAIATAATWENYCSEAFLIGESGAVNLPISDSPAAEVSSNITFAAENTTDFTVESVVVLADIRHFSRGDLEIVLTSPGGTKSILSPGKRPENTQLDEDERWKLMTVRTWGEDATGDWKLSVRDVKNGDAESCVDVPYTVSFFAQEYDCQLLEQRGLCANGTLDDALVGEGNGEQLLALESDGFTLDEACCECGGGFQTTDFEDSFRQWRLVVYGHFDQCNETLIDETLVPSQSPSTSPKATNGSSDPPPPKDFTKVSNAEQEVDKKARLATIAATVVALVFVAFCLWFTLRTPNQGRFRKATQNEEVSFHSANGSMT